MKTFWNREQPMDVKQSRALAQRLGAFDSKKSAFDYFFINEGLDAEQADIMATQVAKARGVPEVLTPPPTGFDKAEIYIEKFQSFANKNPKLAELGIGILTGLFSLGGVGVGAALAKNDQPERVINIDTSAEVTKID